MMKNFAYAKTSDVAQAAEWANATAADLSNGGERPADATVVKAGGVELLDLMKEGLLAPDRVVNLTGADTLREMSAEVGQPVSIGARVTLMEAAESEVLAEGYTALREACHHAATPQVRRMATFGGNLMQRPRCPYFRSAYHPCLKKGGTECYMLTGPDELAAIFDNATCAMVHPSSISTGLLAFDAEVVTTERELPLAEFFVAPATAVDRENVVAAGELITAVRLPASAAGRVSAYQKTTPRDSYDWALVDVAASAVPDGDRFSDFRVVLGAVSPTPMRATAVEAYLNDAGALTDETIARAGELAVEGATPLDGNAYKVPMLAATVRHVLERMAA